MRLPPAQRSAVILKDVLGHSLDEISAVTGGSHAVAKSALQRGRQRLRALALAPEDEPVPFLTAPERDRLRAYVDRFNARDFDAVRAMLADDVRLDLVGRFQAEGRAKTGEYLHRYAEAEQWRFAAGVADGRPAMLVYDRDDPSDLPAYFVALAIAGDRIAAIHDFLLARYVLIDADLRLLP